MTVKSFPSVRALRHYERTRDAEILRRRILDAVEQHGSITMPDLTTMLSDVRPQLLYETCRRMRKHGKLVSTYVKWKKGQYVVWALTNEALDGAHIRHAPPTEAGIEDEPGWVPKPWIHPIRARALGLIR